MIETKSEAISVNYKAWEKAWKKAWTINHNAIEGVIIALRENATDAEAVEEIKKIISKREKELKDATPNV